MCVGDIVILQADKSECHCHWKLAEVCFTKEGRDQKLQSVALPYKQQGHGKQYKGVENTLIERSVQKLALILPVKEQVFDRS